MVKFANVKWFLSRAAYNM